LDIDAGSDILRASSENAHRVASTAHASVTPRVPHEASNPRVSVFAKSPYKHTQILAKDPDTVVAAIDEVVRQSS
jgi:hypothetical protein